MKSIFFSAIFYCHIIICESNNLGLILDKSNIKYLALLDDSMNLNQAKGFMTRFDIKIKFLKHLKDLRNQDFLVTSILNFSQEVANVTSYRQPKRTLVLTSDLDSFETKFKELNLHLDMYVCYNSNQTNTIYGVTTIKDQSIVALNEIEIGPYGLKEKLSNLRGLHIKSITADWWPYVFLDNCKKHFVNCKLRGCLVDLFEEASKTMNFTWSSDHTNDWGLIPVQGLEHYNYSGVLGKVAQKKYDFSLSNWSVRPERLAIAEIPIMLEDRYAMFLIPSTPELDPGFFARPFHSTVWIMSLVLFGFSGFLTYGLVKQSKSKDCSRFLMFSTSISFTLINAYYGGALTMFFLSHSELPFSNIKEALGFPEWKIIFREHENIHLKSPAKVGVPEYLTYWNKVESNPSKYSFPTLEDALNHLASTPNVILTSTSQRMSTYYNNHKNLPPVKEIKEAMPNYMGLLFPKHSPIAPYFKLFGMKVIETGLQEKIFKKWIGEDIPEPQPEDKTVLSYGHLFLSFGSLLGASVISVFMVIFENIFHFKERHQMKPSKLSRTSKKKPKLKRTLSL